MACSKVMMAAVAAVSLVLEGAEAASPEVREAFEQFMAKFEKPYRGLAEEKGRFAAFEQNFNFIQQENAKGHSYTLGIGPFADLTNEEFKKTHACTDITLGKQEPMSIFRPKENATVANSLDWRQQGVVTGVKNQDVCESCWAFSATGAIESAWAIHTGKLVSLSEQQLVDCSGSYGTWGCVGGNLGPAFSYEKDNDICTESGYTYKGYQLPVCASSGCPVGIPKGGVKGYTNVQAFSEAALQQALSQQPVSVVVESTQDLFQHYTGGVITSTTCGTSVDHAALLVGYGSDGGKDYWLVKNSWGAGWGESGYVRIQRGTGGAGICGILTAPSFPVVGSADSEAVVV